MRSLSSSSVNHLFKKIIVAVFLIAICITALPTSVSAEIPTDMLGKTGIGKVLGGENVDLLTLIGNIVKFVLSFLAVVFVILIIYSGFKWMTAGGESKKVDEAKSVMKNAIIGLIIVMCSYAIATVVFDIVNNQVLKGGSGTTPTIGQ